MRPIPNENTRADLMWNIVKDKVDFVRKTVIDLGCGGGDMLWRVWDAGASEVHGVDWSQQVVVQNEAKFQAHGYYPPRAKIFFYKADLNKLRWRSTDIAVCFSVIPYLTNYQAFLKQLSRRHDTSLIECQYWGDGPGLSVIQTTADMRELLRRYWSTVEWLGATKVKGGIAVRDIWMCQ